VDGNRQEAATILGIGERTLYRKLKKYEEEPPEERQTSATRQLPR